MTHADLDTIADDWSLKIRTWFGGVRLIVISANVAALFFFTAETFQRLGALWVAIIIIGFGFLRLSISNAQTALTPGQNLKGYTTHGSKVRLLRKVSPTEKTFAHLEEPVTRTAAKKLVALLETRLSTSLYPLELFMLAGATLQWGFGDLFHCWFNKRGWTTC